MNYNEAIEVVGTFAEWRERCGGTYSEYEEILSMHTGGKA